jgi:hypothetical protein
MAEKKEEKKAEKPANTEKQGEPKTAKSESAENKEKIQAGEMSDSPEKEEEESYLKDLMAISGQPGLYRFVSQGRNGIIVESIETGKRMQAFATMKVSALEDIAIYTEDEEVKFETVIASIHKYEKGKETISPKSSPDDLKDYFSAILPEYDRERVYVSDIKKILSWYNLLLKYDLIRLEPNKKAAKAESEKEAKPSPAKEDDKGGKKV